ncbi:MAG: sugar phosphate isomerase/epimerase [Eubacteriales bacterium]|nr:sugar phosphate isomerase/epimerase [Eubacteriales bacterium]
MPYWKDFTAFAEKHGIEQIAIELHPGQMCYNPATIKKLRADVGSNLLGVNLDFSHLIWQRMDPIMVIRELKGLIYHVHAKDIAINEQLVKESGLISRTYFHKPTERPWNFRIFGYGHDLGYWRNVFAELRRVGYEYVASIEFECELSSADFGCRAALKNLKDCILTDDVNSSMSWLNHVNRMRTIRNDFYGIGK